MATKNFNVPYDNRLTQGSEENPQVVHYGGVDPAYLSLEPVDEPGAVAYETFLVPIADIDKNGDGFVNKDEFIEFMKSMGQSGVFLGYGNAMMTQTVGIPYYANKLEGFEAVAKFLGNGQTHVAVDARDDKIVLHERLMDAPPSKQYTYAGGSGELLSVSVETDPVRKTSDIGKSSTIDGDTGEQIDEVVQMSKRNIVFQRPVEIVHQTHYMGGGPHGMGGSMPIVTGYQDPLTGEVYSVPKWENKKEQKALIQTQTKQDEFYTWLYNQELKNGSGMMQGLKGNKDTYGDMAQNEYLRANKAAYEAGLNQDQIYAEQDFNSVEDAITTLANLDGEIGIELTDEERQAFWVAVEKAYQEKNQPTNIGENPSPEQIKSATDSLIDVFRIKRLVRVLDRSSRPYGMGLGTLADGNNRRAMANDPVIDADESATYKYDSNAPDGYSTKVRQESFGGQTFSNRYKWMAVEIPLNGTMLVSMGPSQSDIVIGNDMIETFYQQSKLKATAIGDPLFTSSKNVLFNNISCYSGVWYAIKVVHNISYSNGYTMDMEFIERDIEISKNVIKAKIIDTALQGKISEYAKSMVEEKREFEANAIKSFIYHQMIASFNAKDNTNYLYNSQGDIIGGVQVKGTKYWDTQNAETNERVLTEEEMMKDTYIIDEEQNLYRSDQHKAWENRVPYR